jgi:cytoskeletal protein RodZ
MELSTSTWMMIFFIISLVASIWKIYAFLPNKELKDDDTNEASQEELERVMVDTIKEHGVDISQKELFEKMKEHKNFDAKHYWRFNQNRLNHLLSHYYISHEGLNSIEDIYLKG